MGASNTPFADFIIEKWSTEDNQYLYFDEFNFIGNSPSSLYANNSFKSGGQISLPEGKYRIRIENYDFVVYYPTDGNGNRPPGATGNTYWLDANLTTRIVKQTSVGGGLRIKEIYDMADNVNTTSYRKFNYKDKVGSAGHLFITPVYHTFYEARFEDNLSPMLPDTPGVSTFLYLMIRSNPFTALTEKLSESPVGYSNVEEVFGDSNYQGKIKYSFLSLTNSTDGHNVPNSFAIASSCNGLPSSVIKSDKDNYLVEKTVFHYTQSSFESATGLSKFKFYPDPTWQYMGVYLHNLQYRSYSLFSEWWKKDQEITTNYYNQEKDSVVNLTRYSYDPVNYQINNVTLKDSKENTIESRVTYPTSPASPMNTLMKNKFLINIPIEKSRYCNGVFLEQQKTTYSNTLYPNLVLPEYISYIKAGVPENAMIRFNNYDSNGNITEITGKDNVHIVYLWGYNGKYPIAEIKNATLVGVTSALIGTTPAILSSSIIPDMSKVESLRSSLPNAQVTTYTYKTLVGITSMTDPRGLITYYEYDDFNRLEQAYIIENGEKKILQKNDYHYSNQ